jgi:peptide/nickel transport system permease protein
MKGMAGRSPVRRRRIKRPLQWMAAAFLLGLTLLAAIFAILHVTHTAYPIDPAATDLGRKLLSPTGAHWLGTDALGRDVLTRLLHGSYISLSVGFVAVAVELALGVAVGAVAGYFRGTVDAVLMRFVDAVMCFPTFFLVLTAVALIGPNIFNVMIVIGLVAWTRTARLVRAEFLTLRESGYVLAAKALGQRSHWIIIRHIFPNAAVPIFVTAVLGFPEAILLEAGLSFLGFGVQPPTPTWGNIIADGKPYLLDAWWLIIFPGLAIFLTALAFYLVAEAVRESASRHAV